MGYLINGVGTKGQASGKNKVRSLPLLYVMINSKWIRDFDVRNKTKNY